MGGLERWYGWSRVNESVEVDNGRMVWEPIWRPRVEHAAKMWWSGGLNACKKLESVGTDESG